MDVGEDAGETSVYLLRPRVPAVECTQARLDMRDPTTVVEGAETAGHRRGRVALDDDPVGLLRLEHRADPFENGDRHVRQRLGRAHYVEVVVGHDLEQRKHLVDHLAVLRRYAHARAEDVAPPIELAQDRRELDHLRPCAEDRENLDHKEAGSVEPAWRKGRLILERRAGRN